MLFMAFWWVLVTESLRSQYAFTVWKRVCFVFVFCFVCFCYFLIAFIIFYLFFIYIVVY